MYEHPWACWVFTKWAVTGHDPLWSLSRCWHWECWYRNKCCLCQRLNYRDLSFLKLAAEAKYLRSLGQLLWSKHQAVGKAGFRTGQTARLEWEHWCGGCTKVVQQVFSERGLKHTILLLRKTKHQWGSCVQIPALTHYQLKKILVLERHCEQCFPRKLPLEHRKIATPCEVLWELTKGSVVSTEEEW